MISKQSNRTQIIIGQIEEDESEIIEVKKITSKLLSEIMKTIQEMKFQFNKGIKH